MQVPSPRFALLLLALSAATAEAGRDGIIEYDLRAALERRSEAPAAEGPVEPLPPGDPLWRHPKVMLTPHVASESDADSAARFIAEGILAFERGETPEGIVDRARGY